MTETELKAYQSLQALQSELKQRLGSSSRGILDLAYAQISRDLLGHIRTCISAEDHLAIVAGLYVLKGLLIERSFDDLPRDFQEFLINRIGELLNHPSDPVVFDAIDWFSQLSKFFPNYREQMLEFLADKNLGRRQAALRYYQAYAKHREIEPLLRFRYDDYASEVRPLGDWEYDLRNRALELIERQLGEKFPRTLRSEAYEGAQVTWYDWTPFLEWWLKNNPASHLKVASP